MCTERKAKGLFVLANFLFATMVHVLKLKLLAAILDAISNFSGIMGRFLSANAYFFKNLIASQQISTSTHFLPCLTPHKSQSLEN